MKLLLTGSRGFIGSYFIDKYSQNYDVETFSFLRDEFDLLRFDDMDVVVHLSALVHQMNGAKRDNYHYVNVEQTVNLAKKAKQSGVKQFIFMSSVKVYGEESDSLYEANTHCAPQDDYGKSKLEAEEALKNLEDESFKIAIIRTPVVYGYGVKANIKNLINIVKKVSILPLGDIQNRRSMIYVGNLCYILNIIIQKKIGGIFLVSDSYVLSTSKLIELIAEALDKKIYLIKLPFFASLLKLVKPSFYKRLFENLEVDNSQTLHKLQISLPYSTEDGIRYMIEGEI